MRTEPGRTAERLGLDQRTIRWLEEHGQLQQLAPTEPEIRARLYNAHLAYLRPEGAGDPVAPGSATSKALRGREGTTMEKATTRIRGLLLLLACAVLAAAVAAISTPSTAIATGPSMWSGAVTGICAHALLFEGRHQIGTRAGAVAVAHDIRASTARRLRRIRALQIAPPHQRLSTRWLHLERRLAAVYASSYLHIHDAIAAANTPKQRARLPRVLRKLLDAPNALRANAESLEQRLHVPDCTGGGTPQGAGTTPS